jgi:hypothetical protein
MSTATIPIDAHLLTGVRRGDRVAIERVLHDAYDDLLAEATRQLGDDASNAGAIVAQASERLREEHACFYTVDVLEVFLRSAVREAAVSERSQRAASEWYTVHFAALAT